MKFSPRLYFYSSEVLQLEPQSFASRQKDDEAIKLTPEELNALLTKLEK